MFKNGRLFISEQVEAWARQQEAERLERMAAHHFHRGLAGFGARKGLTLPQDDGDPHFVVAL